MVSASPVVRVRGLIKHYGEKHAVRGVNLEVKKGEIFGVIGPDGSGKSTILKTVAGVLAFDAGCVEVLGTNIDSEAAAERVKARIGFMPQGLGLNLYPELSVEENIDFFARLRNVPEDALAVRKERLLRATRLSRFRERPMKQLSGGMKQKLGLVCTLVHEPEVIILDEPTTGVDPVSRRDFWTILRELLHSVGGTALISTAYLDEASRFHRVSLLLDGTELASGTPDALTDADQTGHDLEDVFVSLVEARAAARSEIPGVQEARDVVAVAFRNGPSIEAVELTRDFGRFRAVDRVSFQVRAGEVFGLLGANGAGKTTVLKMLTGILSPSSGSGSVAGADMRRAGIAIKRRIGYMSQAFSLYTDLTVTENIALYAGIYGLGPSEARDRARVIVRMAGLSEHLHDLAASLPMGMRQRLALGCAIVHRPDVLFLDEPTSGVDPLGRRSFWNILHRLAREEGVAILMTTHNMLEAERCDRLALMFRGRLVANASPDALKAEVARDAGWLFELTVDRPEDAIERLKVNGFQGASLFGAKVHVLCPEHELPGVERILSGNAITVRDVVPKPLSMEDVFVFRVTELEQGTEPT